MPLLLVVIQLALLVAVHAQPDPVVTVNDAVDAAAATDWEIGDRE